jgi:hypothetical protein
MLLVTASIAQQQSSFNLATYGTLLSPGCAVYSDYACTKPQSQIALNNLEASSSIQQVIYIKNNGTLPITMHLSINGFVPVESVNVFSITWNREDYLLAVNQSVSAMLTLNVAPNTLGVTDFSFNTEVKGVPA